MDILGAVINGTVDIHGHVSVTINESMDTWVLSLIVTVASLVDAGCSTLGHVVSYAEVASISWQ